LRSALLDRFPPHPHPRMAAGVRRQPGRPRAYPTAWTPSPAIWSMPSPPEASSFPQTAGSNASPRTGGGKDGVSLRPSTGTYGRLKPPCNTDPPVLLFGINRLQPSLFYFFECTVIWRLLGGVFLHGLASEHSNPALPPPRGGSGGHELLNWIRSATPLPTVVFLS